MDWNEVLLRFAQEKEIALGVCDAEPMHHLREILEIKDTPFVSPDIQARIDPKRSLAEAKSVIVVGVGYKKQLFSEGAELRGDIAASAVGLDYHILVNKILLELACVLVDKAEFQYQIFVDTGPLVERELARKAGLGFYGKNCSIISKQFGSFFHIGYMITTLELVFSQAFEWGYDGCGSCELCIKSCPSRCLSGMFTVDSQQCVSFLTQKKGILTDQEKKHIGKQIYGCDVCMTVCPYNKAGLVKGKIEAIDQAKPLLADLAQMSKKEFQDRFGDTAVGWRGKTVICRNALLALQNSQNERADFFLDKDNKLDEN